MPERHDVARKQVDLRGHTDDDRPAPRVRRCQQNEPDECRSEYRRPDEKPVKGREQDAEKIGRRR